MAATAIIVRYGARVCKIGGSGYYNVRRKAATTTSSSSSSSSKSVAAQKRLSAIAKVEQILGRQQSRAKIIAGDPPPSENFVLFYKPSAFEGGDSVVETIADFGRCFSVRGILQVLEKLPDHEVTPLVAVHALKKIASLDEGRSTRSEKKYDDFRRAAVHGKLVDIVLNSRIPRVMVEGLEVLSTSVTSLSSDEGRSELRKAILDEVSQGRFSLADLCLAAHSLVRDNADVQELFAKSILARLDELKPNLLGNVFDTLPLLTEQSEWRQKLLNALTERVAEFWEILTAKDVISVVKTMTLQQGLYREEIMRLMSNWIYQNMERGMSEQETAAVAICLAENDYVDDLTVAAFESYMSKRGCRITEPELVVAVCEYCSRCRINASESLNAVAEFVAQMTGSRCDVRQTVAMARVFGELNFHPPNGFTFWKAVEDVVERNLSRVPPTDIVDLLLSFAYIGHKSHLTEKIVGNPDFADCLTNRQQLAKLGLLRSLTNFDDRPKSAGLMANMCRKATVYDDLRVVYAIDRIVPILKELYGQRWNVGSSIPLPRFPHHTICTPDILISPRNIPFFRLLITAESHPKSVALLIRVPEHYVCNTNRLIGAEALKKRILHSAGISTAEINYADTALSTEELKQRLDQAFFGWSMQ